MNQKPVAVTEGSLRSIFWLIMDTVRVIDNLVGGRVNIEHHSNGTDVSAEWREP